jgi:hypothetical protein
MKRFNFLLSHSTSAIAQMKQPTKNCLKPSNTAAIISMASIDVLAYMALSTSSSCSKIYASVESSYSADVQSLDILLISRTGPWLILCSL